MIKNIIFDLGDIFINLDKTAIDRGIKKFGGDPTLKSKLFGLNASFEIGEISAEQFIQQFNKLFPKAIKTEVIEIWNSILLEIPDYRIDFIVNLARESSYRLFLLSNTNSIHIDQIQAKMGLDKFNQFKACFEKFYLSHEIKLRKPNTAIYEYVLTNNNIAAEETFFIDDSAENTASAEKIGIKCWTLLVGKEDVVNFKSRLSDFV